LLNLLTLRRSPPATARGHTAGAFAGRLLVEVAEDIVGKRDAAPGYASKRTLAGQAAAAVKPETGHHIHGYRVCFIHF
jgi:hypothetical protein